MKIMRIKDKEVYLDDQDYAWLSAWKWEVTITKKGQAAVSRGATVNGKRKRLIMSRVIMGQPKEFQVDHINRNRLDNRRSNLRICTRAQNKANTEPQKNNTSGFKGISWNIDKWRADIYIKGKRIYLGRYSSKEKAAEMYNKAAKFVWGDFAWLNPV